MDVPAHEATGRVSPEGRRVGSGEGWTVVLTCVVEKEGDQFVSYCEELGTSSCGDTIEEAFENIEEAIEVHLDALDEVGELGRVFRERDIEVNGHSSA